MASCATCTCSTAARTGPGRLLLATGVDHTAAALRSLAALVTDARADLLTMLDDEHLAVRASVGQWSTAARSALLASLYVVTASGRSTSKYLPMLALLVTVTLVSVVLGSNTDLHRALRTLIAVVAGLVAAGVTTAATSRRR